MVQLLALSGVSASERSQDASAERAHEASSAAVTVVALASIKIASRS
jgi:hypothetical protein